MITISAQEVKSVVRNLNVTKVSGPDLISPRLLKEAATEYVVRLLSFSIAWYKKENFP